MQRTNTTSLTSFTLPSQDEVTFIFKPTGESPPHTIRIALPPSSNWIMPYHWHPSYSQYSTFSSNTTPCQCVTSLEGHLHVSIVHGISGGLDRLVGAGTNVDLKPDERVSWDRAFDDTKPLTVELVADQTLWRNVCSAVLDREIYPQLSSTPFWLKALFGILAPSPSLRNKLLNLMLRAQIKTIFFAHDFHTSHGYVPVTWPWIMRPFGGRPPPWAERLQLRSLLFIAWMVMAINYWISTLLLGMKGEYVEYTPQATREEGMREKH